MNIKVFSIFALVMLCQVLRTYQEDASAVAELDSNNDEKSSEVEVAAVQPPAPPAAVVAEDESSKKEINDDGDNEPVAAGSSNDDEVAAAAVIQEATEKLAKKPDGSDGVVDEAAANEEKIVVPMKSEVRAAASKSEDATQDEDAKQVEAPVQVEAAADNEKANVEKDELAAAAGSKSAVDVDYNEQDDQSLKLKPAESVKEKSGDDEKNVDLSRVEKNPVGVEVEDVKIKPKEEPEVEMKEPASMVNIEQRVVKVESNIDNVKPPAESSSQARSQANENDLSPNERKSAGEPAHTSYSKASAAGRVNPFFIIIPAIILAIVILIVIVFVLYQKTSLFRSESSLSVNAPAGASGADASRRAIYRQVPTDPARAV